MSKVRVDTVEEYTSGNGITVDGIVIKDTTIDFNGTADAVILDADDFTFTANTFTALSGSTIAIAAGGSLTNAGTLTPAISSTGKVLALS